MVRYECKSCNFKTKLKTDYARHLKTKKHGRNMGCEIIKLEETTLMTQNDPKMTQNDPKMTQNDPKMTQESSKFKCEYCDKVFSTKAHKRRHELHRCKEIPTSFSHEKDKKEWLKEKNKLYNQIDALIKKAGNTTNNNINLNSYGNEDLSHISDSFKTGLLKGPYAMIPKMIKAVHFSDDMPENKNIEITNKKDKWINIFKNGKWEYCKRTEILNDIMNNNYYLLDSHYDEIGKDLLNNVQNMQYSKFKDEFTNGKLDKDTRDDIDLVIINADKK